jgi:hypothetical protein
MTDLPSTISALSLPVLAQMLPQNTDRDAAVWVMVGLAGLAVIVNQVIAAWRNITGVQAKREIQQPLEIKAAQEFAAKAHEHNEFQRLAHCKEMHSQIETQMRDEEERQDVRMDDLRREIKVDIGGVHKRIDAVLAAVSNLGGQITQIGNRGGRHAN